MSDPITRNTGGTARELLEKLAAVCAGFKHQDVQDAVLNLLVNSIRQTHGKLRDAEATFDDRVGRAKQILLEHYDRVTGNRRSVFKYDQHIVLPLLDARDEWEK